MRVGNIFGRVCLSVRLSVSVCPSVCQMSVCPSVCLSVQTITFEPLHIGTSFLVWRYILTISRSSLSIKVIGSRSRSCAKNDYLLISTCYSFVCTFTINKVKVTYQGQGHTSRSRSNQGQHQIEVIFKERYSYMRCIAFESNAFLFTVHDRRDRFLDTRLVMNITYPHSRVVITDTMMSSNNSDKQER